MRIKQFAVIGLGRFGSSVARSLVGRGYSVLGIDSDAHVVAEMATVLPKVLQAETTDLETVRSLRLTDYDVVVVAIGSDMEASILTTLNCKEVGVKTLVAKALSEAHGKVLYRTGADRVVFPERDMGARVANNLAAANILDYVQLSSEHSVAELVAVDRCVGHSLADLELPQRYGINVMAIKRGKQILISPRAEEMVRPGDVLVVIGESTGIRELQG